MSVVVISSSVVMTPPPWGAVAGKPYVSIIEFDVPRCSLAYGVSPCEAALGVTGDRKCFNTRSTCQDLPNFSPDLVTLRFQPPTHQLHRDSGPDVIPSVKVVRTTPQLIAPGDNLGQRESVTIQFTDHLHSDAGFDPYLDERGYDAFNRGTFWGRFRARNPNLQGLPLRVSRGQLGDALEDYETLHYVIESATLSGDTYTVVAKDHLKIFDGDRAQAPRMSRGTLSAAIDDNDGSLTLSPAGIGDAEYPSSGYLAIGGKEICAFNRSGDVCGLTQRGAFNTDPESHEEGDRVQVVLVYTSETLDTILYDLAVTHGGADPSWIDTDAWAAEALTVSPLYSAAIAEPTAVRTLLNELIEQCGLVVWWDSKEMQIRMQALRPVAPGAQIIDDSTMMQETLKVEEQPAKKVTEAWTYFKRRNPLKRLDETDNYGAVAVSVSPNPDPNETPGIRKVFSRWIPGGGLTAAQRVNSMLITRYARPPRLIKFDVFRNTIPMELASRYRIEHWSVQDPTGAASMMPAQIIAVEPNIDKVRVQAEEQSFSAAPDDANGVKQIIIDEDMYNINLRELYDVLYQPPQVGDTVRFTVLPGVKVGSIIATHYEEQGTIPWWWQSVFPEKPLSDQAAIEVGDWPTGITLELVNKGRIQGIGGVGGGWSHISFGQYNGGYGGRALRTRTPITIDNDDGEIWGGGGGGGAGDDFATPVSANDYGGGGAGYLNTRFPAGHPWHGLGGDGSGGNVAYNHGTDSAGGSAGGPGAGAGGGPGQAGSNGSQGNGGAAGAAVDGDSYVTWTNAGDIRGAQVN